MSGQQKAPENKAEKGSCFPSASNGNMVGLSRAHHGTYEVRRGIFLESQKALERPEPHVSGETE